MNPRGHIPLIAILAVLLTGLLAPANATSAWNDKGSPITSEVNMQSAGSFNFSGGADCHESTTYVSVTGLVARILGITFHTAHKTCTPKGTLKSLGCTQTASMINEGLPYSTDNLGTSLTITGVKLRYTFEGGAFCPKSVTLSGSITATPDNSKAISSLTFSGTLASSVAGITASVSGTQAIQGGASGTYGI